MQWRRRNPRPADAAPFAIECRTRFQHGVMAQPGPQTGPETTPVPLTGHELTVTITPRTPVPVWVSGIAVTVDSYLSSENTQPLVAGAELRPPQFVVLLDENPPRLVSAPGHDGNIPRDADGRTEVILAPVTADTRLVCWTLWFRITCGDAHSDDVHTRGFPLRTTAVSHWMRFSPDGGEPTVVPAAEMAAGHWHPPEASDA